MAQDRRSARALAALLPAGAFGFSVSLASADAAATASPDAGAQPKKPGEVAERLQSIRLSVSDALQQYAKDGEPFVAVDPETAARLVGQRLAQRRLGLAQRRLAQWRLGQRLAQRRLGQWLAQWRLGQRLA